MSLFSRRKFLMGLTGLAALSSPMPAHAELSPSRYWVVADILTGDGSPLVKGHALLVDAGRIRDRGPVAQVPSDAVRLNAAVVMPGVINAHVHRIHDSGERQTRYLRHGVTSIGDVGSTPEALPLLAQSPPGETATAAFSGPMLCPPAGYPLPVHDPGYGMVVESPAAGRDRVARLHDAGCSLIKISYEPGPYLRPWPTFDRKTAAAICDAAHRLGMKVRCHVEDAGGLAQVLDWGVDFVDHVPHRRMTPQGPQPVLEGETGAWQPCQWYRTLLERMVDECVGMVPTLDVLERSLWKGPALFEPVRYFHAAGGRLAVGNDYPYRRTDAGMPMREFELLGRAGVDPMDLLCAATRGGAEACNLVERGTTEPGQCADLLLLPGNPLKDLSVLSRPSAVIKDGRVWTGA